MARLRSGWPLCEREANTLANDAFMSIAVVVSPHWAPGRGLPGRPDAVTDLLSALPVPRPALQVSKRDDHDLAGPNAVDDLVRKTGRDASE